MHTIIFIQSLEDSYIMVSRNYTNFNYTTGPPPLGEKGSCDFTTVSMSVGKRFFSKTVYRIFLKLLMKLGCPKGKKLEETDFQEKNLILGIMPQNTPNVGFFGFCKENSILMCRSFGFKSCIMTTFMILLKRHIWEKPASRVKSKNALDQSYCRIFKF